MKKDWLSSLERKRQELLQDAGKVFIVNAGRMNHGKSSLFNALLDKDVFAVEDVRTTVAEQEAAFSDDVIFVDTPGLDANASDDTAAFAAYARASLVVFVHTVRTGAIERDELDSMNQMAAAASSPEYFWKHFVLVFTNVDEYDASDEVDQQKMEEIEAESLRHIAESCGQEGFPVFKVSNTRYQKGKAEQKEKLVELSGIKELRGFLTEHLDDWRQEQAELSENRFAQAEETAVVEAKAEREELTKKLAEETQKGKAWGDSVKERLDSMQVESAAIRRNLAQAQDEAKKWKPLAELEREAEEIFSSEQLTIVTHVVPSLYVRWPSSYEDGFKSYESADREAERKREAYCEECNTYFKPRRSESLCEDLGEAYASAISKKLESMKSKLETALKQAGFSDFLDENASVSTPVQMRGDEEWFGFSLDGKAPSDPRGWMSSAFEEVFDREVSRFHSRLRGSSVKRHISSDYTYETGWFGREKKVRRYSYELDFCDADSRFEELAQSGCNALNTYAHVSQLLKEIMDGLQMSFDKNVMQVLAKRIGGGNDMDVSVSSIYDRKRRQAERLEQENRTSFQDGLERLCLLDGVSDLPTVKDAKNRSSVDLDAFRRGVQSDVETKQSEALEVDQKKVQTLDEVIASIEALQLHES